MFIAAADAEMQRARFKGLPRQRILHDCFGRGGNDAAFPAAKGSQRAEPELLIFAGNAGSFQKIQFLRRIRPCNALSRHKIDILTDLPDSGFIGQNGEQRLLLRKRQQNLRLMDL